MNYIKYKYIPFFRLIYNCFYYNLIKFLIFDIIIKDLIKSKDVYIYLKTDYYYKIYY